MKNIEIFDEYYQLSGFICDIEDQEFSLYLETLFEKDIILDIILFLKSKNIKEVSVLKNIYVASSMKGEGFGNYLIKEFENRSSGLPIILICDNLEIQKENFSLQAWYEKKGFISSHFKSLSGPLMFKF